MFLTKKIALGIAGGAIILGSGFTFATIASAHAPTPSPTPSQSWQRGGGYGRMEAAPRSPIRTRDCGTAPVMVRSPTSSTSPANSESARTRSRLPCRSTTPPTRRRPVGET